jgi:serine/threonine protein kinase
MSPEAKISSTKASFSSDIYSLGIIAYELIIGKLSFGNIQLSLLPKNIRTIIEKALQPDLKNRYNDIVDFITDISQYIKKETHLSERSEKDEMKQMIESLTQSQTSLLPSVIPKWQEIEIGLSRPLGTHLLGFTYDFIRFDERHILFFVAESLSKEIESISHISYLKGLLKMSFHEYMGGAKRFDPAGHLTLINEQLVRENKNLRFRLALLFLDASIGEFHFVGCGYPSLWHLSETSKTPRLLKANNPLLGESLDFTPFEINDSWKEGEQIFFHTCITESSHKEEIAHIETHTKAAIAENLDVSCQTASNHILKTMIMQLPSTFEKGQTLVLSIQRID